MKQTGKYRIEERAPDQFYIRYEIKWAWWVSWQYLTKTRAPLSRQVCDTYKMAREYADSHWHKYLTREAHKRDDSAWEWLMPEARSISDEIEELET